MCSLFFEALISTALNQTLVYLEMFETTKNKTHTSFSESDLLSIFPVISVGRALDG